jgi:Tol biopolymer transport system component/DNA-binding winged helix-turn-helix (wHTH) protein
VICFPEADQAYDGLVMGAETVWYQFDTVEVRPAAFTVLRDGRPANLEPKAVRVLLYLIEHRNRAVSKEELFEAVWEGTAVTDNALTRIVAQIRREIGDDARQAHYIQTLPTMGYRFVADLRIVRPEEAQPPPPRPKRRLAWALGVVVAVVIVTFSDWLFFRRGVPGSGGELRPVQLTTSPGLDIGASFSPDGKSFVYCTNRSGRFEIYRRPVASSVGEIQVTNDGKQNIEPAWSPDGKWIAYHSVAQHGIWLVPVAGGSPRRLTAFGSAPAWSPDGRQIAFRSSEPPSFAWSDLGGAGGMQSTIWTVAADGSQFRQVTDSRNPAGQHAMPTWSPDGKRLIFVAMAPSEYAIRSLDLASGKIEMLAAAATRLASPRFDPTGKGLYFAGMSSWNDYGIYLLRRAGERPMKYYATHTEVPLGISISPDGKRLLFTRFSNISQLWTVTPPAEPKPLFQEAVLRVSLPSFSPDGKLLASNVDIAGRNQDLWVMKADGTGAEPVSSDPRWKNGTFWNREGGLLYSDYDENRLEFRRYDPVRKTSQVLYSWPSARGLYLPSLMPDEREVLSSCSDPLNICLSPAQGGSPRQITFDREPAVFPFASHDGQWIIYNARRGDTTQIGITDRNGGHQEVLTDDPWSNFATSFSADNRRIAYFSNRDGAWNIWWIDRFTRERKQLTHYTTYGPYVRAPTWRPGTEEMVYEYSQVKGNVYLLNLQ